MSDSNPPRRGAATGPIEFGEWLELTAESRGVSREEVLEQLISSYWTLNEMSEMIREPEDGEGADGPYRDPYSESVSGDFAPLTRSEHEEFEGAVEAQLADVGRRLDALEASLDADQGISAAELKRRMDVEFQTLRRIFEHLIEKTDSNEGAVQALEESVDREATALREERLQLDHLKRQAMTHEMKSADCDYCGTAVDLSLLPTPACPACGRTFTGVRPRGEFLGIGIGSHTLETKAPASGEEGRPTGSRPDRGGSAGRSDPRDDRVGGFVWGEERRELDR